MAQSGPNRKSERVAMIETSMTIRIVGLARAAAEPFGDLAWTCQRCRAAAPG